MIAPASLTHGLAGRYEFIAEIGRGGAAVVYRARDIKHDRDVAIKVLHEELTQSLGADRFLREIGIIARLTHPNILPLYDSGETAGCFYYVMPFIEGESLRSRLERERQLPVREALGIAKAVATALDCAHAHGIVHRDIKPENILIASGQPLLSDFGIARVLQVGERKQERLTSLGIAVGTPAYMSPEQASGEADIDPRSDVYSLGCVLYEMLAGQPPFAGQSLQALIASRLTQDAPDVRTVRPEVPDPVASLLSAMLARASGDRVQTAGDLTRALDASDLESALLSGSTYATTISRRTVRSLRRRSWVRVGAMSVVALTAALWLGRAALGLRSDGRVRTLAVLPIANLTGDVAQDHYADGLTDALITELSRLPSVRVISRTSIMQYKLMPKPLVEIARENGADALIEASYTRDGDRVRIMAKLVRGSDEQSLWGNTYNGRVEELMDLQHQVAVAVAREIGAKFSADDGASVAVKPESQDAFLKGSSLAAQWRLEEAKAAFTKAVEIDPANASAYAALARVHYFRAFFGEVAPMEAFSQMRTAAGEALAQNERLAEAHGVMALVNTHFDYDWRAAEQHFRRALELMPSNAQVHHDYSHFLLAMGRGAESLESSRHAVELDPANSMLMSCLGWHSLFEHRFDEALDRAAASQKLMPSFWGMIVQGWAEGGKGTHAAAVASMREAVSLAPGLAFADAALAQALARNGERKEAEEILARLLARVNESYVSAYDVALVYANFDDRDRAFEWLAKALIERSMFVVHLKWDARLRPLRSDPRFDELVRRLGIPTAAPPRTRADRTTA